MAREVPLKVSWENKGFLGKNKRYTLQLLLSRSGHDSTHMHAHANGFTHARVHANANGSTQTRTRTSTSKRACLRTTRPP
eukprot:365835-Chlamydomonas_euryale.AAC.6